VEATTLIQQLAYFMKVAADFILTPNPRFQNLTCDLFSSYISPNHILLNLHKITQVYYDYNGLAYYVYDSLAKIFSAYTPPFPTTEGPAPSELAECAGTSISGAVNVSNTKAVQHFGELILKLRLLAVLSFTFLGTFINVFKVYSGI
jgi:hypothetical protein